MNRFEYANLSFSQILAEFDFPASGLGKLASKIPLPLIPDGGTDPRLAEYQFFFLALISMRKLLNRILYHLYSRGMLAHLLLIPKSQLTKFIQK